jgi:lantibiotic modifying enzyme
MGHGASGIAYALMEYHAATGAHVPREIAFEGVRYERGWFSRKESNWADIRGLTPGHFGQEQPSGVVYPVFWCHGAAGIGLTRLRFYEISKNETFLAEVSASVQAAARLLRQLQQYPSSTWGYHANFSVCHGLGSIIDLLTYAYQVLGSAEYLAWARSIGDQGIRLSNSHQGQWQCGIPNGWEHPGLMLGLAGIGMNYLRLSEPHTVPSIGIIM